MLPTCDVTSCNVSQCKKSNMAAVWIRSIGWKGESCRLLVIPLAEEERRLPNRGWVKEGSRSTEIGWRQRLPGSDWLKQQRVSVHRKSPLIVYPPPEKRKNKKTLPFHFCNHELLVKHSEYWTIIVFKLCELNWTSSCRKWTFPTLARRLNSSWF